MLCTASQAAAATPGGPPIAYAQESGTTYSVYLQNPDGSGKVKLYTAASKTYLAFLDMKPGGNELTVQENTGSKAVLKIIRYNDAGTPIGSPATVPNNGCTVQGFDYHPSDGSLIVSRYCNNQVTKEVRRYANGAWDSSPLVSYDDPQGNLAVLGVRWLGDGSGFLWAVTDITSGARIQRHMLTDPSAPVNVWNGINYSDLPTWFDVARCSGNLDSSCSKILVTNNSGEIHLITFDSMGSTDQGPLFKNAADGHFSSDNSHVLWRQQLKSGYQLMIDSSPYGAKGTYGGKDWHP
jgi:hypothetical protein